MTSKRRLPGALLETAEGRRLQAAQADPAWRRWGPYLSDRQWGTVREDYSPGGAAWDYFPHDQARSRAYRWGEDGIAGFGDDQLRWCLTVALWNGRDPILKERLFGLTNSEGNHGEDVKELYFHGDGLPTHAYMRMLYKYPRAEFPYARLVEENQRRGTGDPEFELIDTGVFDEGRYFDVTIEYTKADPADILMRGGNSNWRGPIWMPVDYPLVESLRKFHRYYGDEFLVECPCRFWPVRQPRRGGGRGVAPPCRPVSARPRRAPPGARRPSPPPGGFAFPGPSPVPRILPRRHGPWRWRRASDRLDRSRGPAPPTPRRGASGWLRREPRESRPC